MKFYSGEGLDKEVTKANLSENMKKAFKDINLNCSFTTFDKESNKYNTTPIKMKKQVVDYMDSASFRGITPGTSCSPKSKSSFLPSSPSISAGGR
jgi:hypothetical protein